MRDDKWLAARLDNIWKLLFPEVEKKNNVVVRFKGKWKNKFGHIRRLKNMDSEIVVNGLFKNMEVPEYIIDVTLAHELVHYMHGFHSPHPKMFSHPHKGGIVNRELRKRGFGHLIKLEREFTKKTWLEMYDRLNGNKSRKKTFIFRLFN